MARMIPAKKVKEMLAEGKLKDLRQWVDSQRTELRGKCPICGKNVRGQTVRRMYDSNACKQEAYRRRRRGEI